MVRKLAVVSMVGCKAEREKLRFRGNCALRGRILAEDTLKKNGNVDALLVTGISNYQMKAVDAYLLSLGYVRIISPDYKKEKQPWRYTCLTAAYVKESIKASQIRYDETTLKTKYRYAAFCFPEGIEIRLLHVPSVDSDKPNHEKQLDRKKSMLSWEKGLEESESCLGKRVIVCGDFNTEIGNLECHDIFDALPYYKMMDEPTWNDAKIDNVLLSLGMKGKVSVHTDTYRLGQTSDHKTVIIDIED